MTAFTRNCVFHRKRRVHRSRRRQYLAVAILLLSNICTSPRIAAAAVSPDQALKPDYDRCIANFSEPGGDPAGVVLAVDRPNFNITITRTSGMSNTQGGGDVNPWIQWNPAPTGTYEDGVQREGCSTLYHELDHVKIAQASTVRRDVCYVQNGANLVNTGIPVDEVEATRDENRYRYWRGLPRRTVYQSHPLPPDNVPCYWPDKPSDQNPYPTQISGTFVLSFSPDPYNTSGSISFSGARIPNCASYWGCEYSLTNDHASLQVKSKTCKGSTDAPPWLGNPGFEILFRDRDSNPGDYRFLIFGINAEAQLTLACTESGRTYTMPGVGVLSGLGPALGVEWHPGMMDMTFDIQAQDGRRGSVSLQMH